MTVLRALLIVVGGLSFLFLPGSLIALFSRRGFRYNRGLLLWGMAVLVIALLPANYITSLVRYVAWPGTDLDLPSRYLVALIGSGMAAIFTELAKYLVLRWRKVKPSELLAGGVMVGFGVGLLTKVFLGLVLVGAGFRLLFGGVLGQDLSHIADQPWLSLIVNLAALVVDRLAIVLVNAALGLLVARALLTRRMRWLLLSIALNTAFGWVYAAIGLALGMNSLAGSSVIFLYEGILAWLVLRWLIGQFRQSSPAPVKRVIARASPKST